MTKTIKVALFGVLILCISGCSHFASSYSEIEKKQLAQGRFAAAAEDPVIARLEDSREKTALEQLNSQVIAGIGDPADVPAAHDFGLALVAGDPHAEAEYQTLVKNSAKWAAEKAQYEAKLLELGKQKEVENNKTILSRIWAWLMATVGLGGIIAICVIFPPALPIIGSLATWAINFSLHLIVSFEQSVVAAVSTMAHKKPNP